LICKRCDVEFHEEVDRKLICMDCNVQLDLLDKEKIVNDGKIKRLEEHKRSELKNPTSKETMKRIERNLQIEYEKHDGIIKMMNSKVKF